MAELEEAAASETATLSKKERKKLKVEQKSMSNLKTNSGNSIIEAAPLSTTQAVTNPKSGNKNSKEYARMLESFWKLSEYNEATRIEGTRNIVKYFEQVRQGDEAYSYVLTRLVKGLASNRKCSRLGYSACLTEIINSARWLTLAELLAIAKPHLVTNNNNATDKQSSLTKEELRQMHIGLLFVYLAWIQSIHFHDSDDLTIQTIVNDLNSMRKDPNIKAYVRQLYLQGLIILIKNLSNGTTKNQNAFKTLLLPALSDDLKSVFSDSDSNSLATKNKDNLNLLVASLNSHKDETSLFLKSHSLKAKTLFSSHTLDSIYDILSHSSESLPSMQPICIEIITYLMEHQTAYFNQMWSNVVDSRLAGKKEPEKKLLAFKFFVLALSQVTEDTYSTLIGSSEQILKMFVSNYVNRQSNLSDLMRDEMSKSLVEVVRSKDGVITLGADLIIKLISHTRNFHDMSDLIGSLIQSLKQPSLSKLFDFFTHDLLKSNLKIDDREATTADENNVEEAELKEEQLISKQIWMLTKLSAMARTAVSTPNDYLDIVDKILGYLLKNAYFCPSSELNPKAVESARNRVVELVGVLLAVPTTNRLRQILKSIDAFEKLFKTSKLDDKYVKKKSELEKICCRISRILKKVLEHLSQLKASGVVEGEATTNDADNKSTSTRDSQSIFQTFFMVVSIELFRSFDSLKNSQQVINDVEVCLNKFLEEIGENGEKAKKKEPKNAKQTNGDSNSEIYWLDVLLEILLNLITINTTWIRNSVKAQFKKLIPRLRVSSVQLIVDLLNPEAELGMFGDEDDDDDDDVEMIESDHENQEVKDKKSNGLGPKVNGDHLKKNKKKLAGEDDIESISFTESSLRDQVKENGGKSNGKKRKASESSDEEEDKEIEASEEEEEDDDEDDDDDDDGDDDDDDDEDEEEDEVDPELKSKLEKALGNAIANGDESSDLDDEAMLKLDDTIAQAFRMRKKDKQLQKDIVQYKSRVLDFIQEVFKSNHRLDLTTYLIKPMFELLFETQTKANLKFLSQRILDFLMNIKNSTRRINEAKLPNIDDLFDLLGELIKFSTTHFNVTNTLVETSMFCVRLIVHISSLSKSDEQKASIIKRLNDIYSEMIRNEKPKDNSNMYKEFLVRYPNYSIPLVIQLIDSASGRPDIKVHKKTVTLVILHQCVNNQMFNTCENKQIISLLIEKIFKFFDEIMEDILKHESFHIKFVDAFVNLVTRVLNLSKTLLKRELNEKLANKLEQLSKEPKFKQAYKSCFQNLIQLCNRTASQLTTD